MKTINVEIVVVGSELLLGTVLDSNSHWVCKRMRGLGGQVNRVVTVRDDVLAISREIEAALGRQCDLVFTLGGLGPTADDMTLIGVAQSSARELELNESALAFVQSRYAKFARDGSVDSAELTEARRKMAVLPKGAEPLDNNVGAAPGVLLRLGTGQMVVSLPGVPEEMKDIFTNSLMPILQEVFGSGAYLEWTMISDCGDESLLSPILRKISRNYGDAYIKSRPERFGPDVRLQITLALRGDSREGVTKRLEEIRHTIEASLRERGISVLETKK